MSKSTLKPTDEDKASDVEEAHRIGEGIFDQHALGVAGDDRCGLRLHVIGEQDGGLFMAEIGNEELAERALLGTHLLVLTLRRRSPALAEFLSVEIQASPCLTFGRLTH
jgi:hypothetical protein